MIYKAIVQDGGVFIPNVAEILTQSNIENGDVVDIEVSHIMPSLFYKKSNAYRDKWQLSFTFQDEKDAQVHKQQRRDKVQSMAGLLKSHANATLMPLEKDAVALAIKEKYGRH